MDLALRIWIFHYFFFQNLLRSVRKAGVLVSQLAPTLRPSGMRNGAVCASAS